MKGAVIIERLKADPMTKDFLRDDKIFADLINGLLFEGNEVISSDDVEEGDTDSATQVGLGTVNRRNDITKKVKVGEREVIIRIENQQRADDMMAVRNGEYTLLKYSTQKKEKKRMLPVFTITLYYGEEKWQKSKRLAEMVEVPKELLDEFQDWDARIVDLKEVDPHRFKNRERREFIDTLQKLYEWNRDLESLRGLVVSKRSAFLAGVVTGTKELVEKILKEKGGEINMCKAVDEYGREQREIGLRNGIVESIKNIMMNLNMSIYDAMKILNIPESEYENYINLL